MPRPWYKPGWMLRLPFMGGACTCEDNQCKCCTGIKIKAFGFEKSKWVSHLGSCITGMILCWFTITGSRNAYHRRHTSDLRISCFTCEYSVEYVAYTYWILKNDYWVRVAAPRPEKLSKKARANHLKKNISVCSLCTSQLWPRTLDTQYGSDDEQR